MKPIYIIIFNKNFGRNQTIEVARFAFARLKSVREYKKEAIADYKNLGWKVKGEIVKIEAYINTMTIHHFKTIEEYNVFNTTKF